MISDLDELKKKLASNIADKSFVLDIRTAEQRLNNIAQYSALIPFASNQDATWDSFWLAGSTAQQLSDIYQNAALAEQRLPVQQTFLLALLQLLETPTQLLNTLPARHRALYYYDLLGFALRNSQPDSVVVNFELQRNTTGYLLPAGTALDAGQDSAGNTLSYLTDENLLITPQQLSLLCWTRQDTDGSWWVSTALDQASNISLPDEGIRLFSQTDNESAQQQQVSQSLLLATLTGDLRVENTLDTAATLALVGKSGDLDFQRDGTSAVFRLSAQTLQKARNAQPQAWTAPQLVLRSPTTQGGAAPDALTVAIDNCQETDYVSQDGAGHLDTFSYPFGAQPQLGSAFELTLPVAFSRTGGTLTIQPQWRDLPQQSFAQWYADYPEPPADNAAFKAQIVLVAPDGTEQQGDEQPLFSGEGTPQGEPLHVIIPADTSATAGYIARVVLSGADFNHAAWQQSPEGKNAPWTPQVSRIDTTFAASLSLSNSASSAVRLAVQDSGDTAPALYLGFSEVTPGETLSVYWSLNAPASLNLSWFYYSNQGEWVSLSSGVLDSTGGLSTSALWRAVLPEDSAAGSDFANFSADYYWIKAEPADGDAFAADTVPRLNAIFAGAMTATLDTTGTVDNSHYAQALPAGTISQLASPVTEISSVTQLLPSTGGQIQETQDALLQRAATRIAHRQRAISWGNMRSMLMDRYPQLYDVQFPDEQKLNHIPALTEQQLLAIPDSRYRDNDDALRPALSSARLAEMASWLQQYTSLWATPELLNPTYIDVTALYRVIFIAGISPDYGYRQLESWLQQRYMPWGDDQKQAVTPGNRVDYYQLLATLQQSPLVQRVVSLTLTRDGGEAQQQTISASDNEVLILNPVPDLG
ncbi:hypothetical protein EDF81_0777 [Enterobacter sp. BIGb0383]|uniref:hypothetical protein n=1 Tax=unclassified Enterobacter TaxID=2608935 RepID=UPI000F4A76C1|nr:MULTISPECIES: hypothetical protein [unclassified Enterobacter]ROP62292.1 hypothetical protein EDF81_0777 [Enterobacter sp. BIGb0383]ROS12453.1 hypothetical protein EC848_0779 [Enterobacter sp. BIGb0359]